jgi:transcription antitermination factor NusG
VRGGQEEKIIENTKKELEKSTLKDQVRDLKIFNNSEQKKVLKGYIFCYCHLDSGLVSFFHKIPGIINFLNHQRKDKNLPDFVSPEVVKNFSAKLQVKKKNKTMSEKHDSNLNVGDLVKIIEGTFINYEGKITYLDKKKQKVRIIIETSG